jgi:DNA-binding protein HU-beta
MNKFQLVDAIAAKTSSTKKDAEAALNAFMEVVMDTVAEGDKVTLVGFGTFEARDRAERQGRNPQTGETMTIPATRATVFVAGKTFKDIVTGAAIAVA